MCMASYDLHLLVVGLVLLLVWMCCHEFQKLWLLFVQFIWPQWSASIISDLGDGCLMEASGHARILVFGLNQLISGQHCGPLAQNVRPV